MPWQHLRISRFGGPEVLQMVEESTIPEPGPGEVRIKVLAAGTGFTDTMIRRGRYPDFKGPLPFTPGYEIVGVIEKTGAGVVSPLDGEIVAVCASLAAMRSMRSAHRAFSCPSPMASTPPRRSASRWPTSLPFTC
jgi:NADPH:quinone reductase-like Zn-dependent oxidoreductase